MTTIAVIGTEIGGLVAGYLSAKAGHKVVLYPNATGPSASEPIFGMAQLATVQRLMAPRAWRQTLDLCRTLGVPTKAEDPAIAFTFHEGPTFLRLGTPQSRLGTRPRIGSLDLANRQSAAVALGLGRLPDPTTIAAEQSLDEFANRHQLADVFYRAYLLPILALANGLDDATLRTSPARPLIGLALDLSRSRPMRVWPGGANALSERLVRPMELSGHARVAHVVETDKGLKVQTETGHARLFDHVLVATHANQANFVDGTQFARERSLLAYIRYEPIELVTHRDSRFMPPLEADWSPVNIAVTRTLGRAAPTMWLNPLLPTLPSKAALFQTLAPLVQPAPETVVTRTKLLRAAADRDSTSARKQLERLAATPGRRLHFCMTLPVVGVPLLESAIGQAKELALRIGQAR